ncbi:JmjC domain-containing protein 4, partial [Mucuna pruriens]
MGMGVNIKGQIERVNGKELSYSEFVERYMKKNQPVVLTGLMDPHHWRAFTDWVTLQGQPNFHFFSTHFGDSKVQVADCDTREFTDQKREEMLISEFIERCLQLEETSSVKCNNENRASNGPSVSVPYLKDWHFVKEYPEYVAYITPMFFCDDWLNLYLDNFRIHIDPDTHQPKEEICCSDYRFVYMGDLGLLFMLMFSGLIAGQQMNMKNCVYNIFEEVSSSKFPGFSKLDFSASAFSGDYNEAKEYIEDIKDVCDDFEGLCQRNLAANTGAVRYGSTTGSSSTISQHLSMNLGRVRKIASEMKHMRALEENRDCVVDMIKAFEDPRFYKLCMHVGRTYAMIHEQIYLCSDFETTSMSDLVDLNDMKAYTSHIYTPEDLIKFIDNDVAELGDCFIEEPSVLYEKKIRKFSIM